MNLETIVVTRELNQSGKGQNYAFVIALAFLLIEATLVYLGHDVSGTIIGSIDLVSLAAVFIVGKYGMGKSKKISKTKEEEIDEE